MDREKLMKDLQALHLQKAKYEGAIEYIAQQLVALDKEEALLKEEKEVE
jgi:hypothetical protein